MSNEEYIAPIDHSAGSAAASTAAGAAGGAVKGGFNWIWKSARNAALIFGAIALVWAVMTVFPIAAAAPGAVQAVTHMAPIVHQLLTVLGITAGVTALGAGVGAVIGGLTAPVGAAVGAVKGGSKASREVKMERGAAAELQAQIALARAQNPAAQVYAPASSIAANDDMKYNAFPPQGAPMNPALPRGLQAGNDNLQYDGRVSGAQLAQAL